MGTVVLGTDEPMFPKVVDEVLRAEPHRVDVRWGSALLNGDPGEAIESLLDGDVLVVALGPGLPLARALLLAEALDRFHPELSVVLVTEPTADIWQQAGRVGIREVISPTAGEAEVRTAFMRAIEVAEQRLSIRPGNVANARASRSRVITVISPKGGVGKTTIATNLAVGLAGRAPGQTVLVDLDMQFGDVASALQLIPTTTLVDAMAAGPNLDITALKVMLSPHPSNAFALCAPPSPVEGDDIGGDAAAVVVAMLAGEFDYVVIDTASGLGEVALGAIELSTDLVMVCSLDVPSIQGMRKAIDALDRLQFTGAQRHLVLNRADARVGLSLADIEATLGMRINVAVPSSRAVPVSTNRGSPVLESDPRSPVAREFENLVSRFMVSGSVEPARNPLWRRRNER